MKTQNSNGYCTPKTTVIKIQMQRLVCYSPNGSETGADGEGQGPANPGGEEEG